MTHDDTTAPLTGATGLVSATAACRQVGLDPEGARLLRLGQNALYTLDAAPIVVRVARSNSLVDRVTREVETARWLQDLNFPAVRLAAELPQVIDAHDRLVTFWQLAPDTGEQATTADLGRTLRDLHKLSEPPFSLATFDPFIALTERLSKAEGVPEHDLRFLEDLAGHLGEQYRALASDTATGFIHADAHRNNLLVTPDGPLLMDFDWVANGPREWDLTPTAVAAQRFGLSDGEYHAFADAYGRDVTIWPGYATLRAIREVTMTTWLMQNIGTDPQIAAEFATRVRCLREGDHVQRWRAF